MTEANLPRILIVDDEDADVHAIGIADGAQTRSRHPNDVDADDLDWADLVLVDFVIDHWRQRDELEAISLQPVDGLALASVLRETADSHNGNGDDYTAFAIHTGHIGKISRRLHTTSSAAHVVARLNNLEWVFEKSDRARFERSKQLATAVCAISKAWKDVTGGGVETAMERLLGLTVDVTWRSRALDDIVLSQLPLSRFSAGTNGLLFLRWLLHSILPYPTFLWGDQWVAASLRLGLGSLRAVLDGDSELGAELDACRYRGILDSFLGPRWWRGGIEQFAWSVRAAADREPEAYHSELERRAGTKLEAIKLTSPVVCIGRDLVPTDELCSLEEAVRLVPDLWPAYADSAYAKVTAVLDDAELVAIVHPLDRDRVEPAVDDENEAEG